MLLLQQKHELENNWSAIL